MKYRTKKSIVLSIVFIVVWITADIITGLLFRDSIKLELGALSVLIAAYILGMGDNWREEEKQSNPITNGE